mgnify:FL=1
MTDLANRTEYEEALAGKLSRTLTAQERALIKLLGSPPDMNNVPPAFWTDMTGALVATIGAVLTEIYLDSSEALMTSLPIGVDWALVNEGAAQWARSYAGDLVKGITDTTRRAVGEAVTNFFTQQQTMGDLTTALGRTFGPVRAEMIAVTEVTRAASEGERAIARQLRDMGVEMIPVWQTNKDELVCPICGPKSGKPITDGAYPPAHPRCRCWVNHELPKVRR